MIKQNRIKAVSVNKYAVDKVDYIALDSFSGCQGCVADVDNKHLCNELPICTDADISVIFIKSEQTNQSLMEC